jgi:hypothetical protein
MVVPTGGAAVSASNSGGGATTVTTPAASYYMTAAGGVSSLIDTFESQLNTSRAPSSGAWTVALGSDGRVSIGCTGTTAIPSFSIDWSSTVLRDVLGFQYAINYPTTATEMARQFGGGTWTSGAGYLCNETSGALAAAFGLPATLTAVSSPTYSNQGPRGGADLAVGFNSNADAFSGGDNWDITGTDDLLAVWVAHHTAAPTDTLFSKYDGGSTRGWTVSCAAGALRFQVFNGATTTADTAALPTGTWYVGAVVVDRSTGKQRSGHCAIGGSPSVSAETTIAANTSAHAVAFGLGASTWLNGTTDMRVAAFYIVTGSGVATGMSAGLSAALSTFAGQFGTITGTEQAEGVWYPDAPLTCDDHPSMAPRMSDLRTSQSPTGVVLGLSGNTYFKHTNVGYQRVPVDRIREASATYANASLEVFWEHTQLGLGPSWFSVSSPVQVSWSDAGVDTLLGEDETITGWTITGAGAVKDIARPSQRNWVGQFDVTLPALIASGS